MDQMTAEVKVPKRILNTLLSSLSAGVVPRVGAPYIAIGRSEEIGSLLDDLDATADGGAACRFLIGRYGSGKSFLIQLVRGYALDRGFITADADLSPERRLTGGSGAGLATYRELISNLASKACPDGGALQTVLSRHLTIIKNALVNEGVTPDMAGFDDELKKRVYLSLSSLEDEAYGFDFARVLGEYYAASISDDSEKRSACLRYLRGEFANRTEARGALGFSVSNIIGDDNWYGFIKLFASLARSLGYAGLLLLIDECVNLYKIPNRISREANYEMLLAIFNDTLQGKAKGLAVLFGGTPQFLEDTRRGLFSYDALKSRLADSRYTELGYRNLSGPVIRLRRLSDNELYALVKRLAKLYAQREGLATAPVTDAEAETFIRSALARAGAEEMITPREIIRDFLAVLNLLRDNPTLTFGELSARVSSTATEPIASEKNAVSEEKTEQKRTIGLFDIDI